MRTLVTPRQHWLRTALLCGVAYFLIGFLLALPATQVRMWRLAAWLISACVFAAHIGHEQFRLRNSAASTALHAAAAVAFGAFLLAVAATVRALTAPTPPHNLRLYGLALVGWPLLTAVPAFLVALATSAVLRVLRRA